MKRAISILSIALFAGCTSKDVVFESFTKDFPDNRWAKGRSISLPMQIAEPVANAKLQLSFRHVHGFQLAELPVQVSLSSPDGKTQSFPVTLKVMKSTQLNDAGEPQYCSDCSGDYCDLDTVISTGLNLEQAGAYSWTISNDQNLPYLPNVMGMGVSVKK